MGLRQMVAPPKKNSFFYFSYCCSTPSFTFSSTRWLLLPRKIHSSTSPTAALPHPSPSPPPDGCSSQEKFIFLLLLLLLHPILHLLLRQMVAPPRKIHSSTSPTAAPPHPSPLPRQMVAPP